MPANDDMAFSPSLIHRAIDQATVLKVELQRLRQHVREGAVVGEDRLAWVEGIVDQLSVVLIECRDRSESST
jgi:hypothetical protein